MATILLIYLANRHWLQFADDAAAVTSLESANQTLLNAFSRWCSWSKMTIRVDKCHSFGIKVLGKGVKQVKPNLTINNQRIHPVEIDESFTYLGRHFDFKMTSEIRKAKLITETTSIMDRISQLPLHPRFKIQLYQRYYLSKISWDLTISDLSITWVKQALDNIVNNYIRLWLDIPICGTLNLVTLSRSRYGLNITLPSTRFIQCQVSFRSGLKTSKNMDIVNVHNSTSSGKNIQVDTYTTAKQVIKEMRTMTEERIVTNLSSQSLVIKSIWASVLPSSTNSWYRVLESMPRSIYNFSIRYLNNTLPNRSNMVRWSAGTSTLCNFCPNPQTLGHVVGACPAALKDGRYTWRHNSILFNFARVLTGIKNLKVYADLDGAEFPSPSVISGEELRPDLIVAVSDKNTEEWAEIY